MADPDAIKKAIDSVALHPHFSWTRVARTLFPCGHRGASTTSALRRFWILNCPVFVDKAAYLRRHRVPTPAEVLRHHPLLWNSGTVGHLAALAALRVHTDIQDTCSICLEAYRDPVLLTRCAHAVCRSCLATYLRKWTQPSDPVCPLCRLSFTPRDFVLSPTTAASRSEQKSAEASSPAAPS